MNGAANKRVLALLPARGGSKRIPRKNIIEFHGRPMLTYPVQAAQESGLFDLIHVSTDCQEIADIARSCNADVRFLRSSDLADDLTGMLPVARWVLRQFDALGEHFDDVFILFPAAPMLEPQDLIGAYDVYKSHKRKRNLISVSEAPAFAEWFFKRDADGRLSPMHKGGAFMESKQLTKAYYETGTFTIFSREWLHSTQNLTNDENYISYELPHWKAVDIDTFEDLEHANLLLEAMKTRRARNSDAGNS